MSSFKAIVFDLKSRFGMQDKPANKCCFCNGKEGKKDKEGITELQQCLRFMELNAFSDKMEESRDRFWLHAFVNSALDSA